MQLVEQHVIGKSDPRYPIIDRAAFASKNLYNAALYEMRQLRKVIPDSFRQGIEGVVVRPVGLPTY